MVARNDVTGDKIQTKTKGDTQKYEDNFDKIFRKQKDSSVEPPVLDDGCPNTDGCYCTGACKPSR